MSDSIVIEESNGEIIVIEPTVVINQNAGVDQIPADWNQADNTKPDFIKNKPTIPGAPGWGDITGNLADQSDLVAEFAKKMNVEPTVLPSGTNYDTVIDTGVYFADESVILIVNRSGDFVSQIYLENEIFNSRAGSVLEIGNIDWFQSVNSVILDDALFSKVDKVDGKGLSTNDYTTTEKNKLAGIEAGAQVNVIPTWNSVTDKPETFPPAAHTHSGMVTSSTIATIVTLTQTAYDALNPKVTTTLYIITGA